MAAGTADAVPWWQWALFVPGGVGISILWWRGRDKPTVWRPAWTWRTMSVVGAVVLGPAIALLGLTATIWTLVARPGG